MVGLVGQEGGSTVWTPMEGRQGGQEEVSIRWAELGAPLPEAAQVLADREVERRTDGVDAPFLSDRGARQKSFNSSATTARR
jgi:hypothetical protein